MDDQHFAVLVIEDHLGIRKGLELLLRSEGLQIAGVAGDVDRARALLARCRYDVALIDIHLGEENALGLVEEQLRADPDAAIVLYTGILYEPTLAEAMRAGTRGFVLKSSPAQRLITALRDVASGGHYVDPDLALLLTRGTELSRLMQLSPREHEILGLLSEGLSGQAIARRLFLSPETVRTHVRNATAKLGAKTRVEAVAMMVQGRGARHATPARSDNHRNDEIATPRAM